MRISNNSLGPKITQTEVAKKPDQSVHQSSVAQPHDRASELSLSNKDLAQIQYNISLVQVAENSLQVINDILLELLELTTQFDTLITSDKEVIQARITQLIAEINQVANTTEYNNQQLLNGTIQGKPLYLSTHKNDNIVLTITSMTAENLGLELFLGEPVSLTQNTQFSNVTVQNPTANEIVLRFAPARENNIEIALTTAELNEVGELVITLAQAAGDERTQGTITATLADLIEVLQTAGLKVNVDPILTELELNTPLVRENLGDLNLPVGLVNGSLGIAMINGALLQVDLERSKLNRIEDRLQQLLKEIGTFAQNVQGIQPQRNLVSARVIFVWIALFIMIIWLLTRIF